MCNYIFLSLLIYFCVRADSHGKFSAVVFRSISVFFYILPLFLTYFLLHSCLCYGLFYILTIGIAIILTLTLFFLSFLVSGILSYKTLLSLLHIYYMFLMFCTHLLHLFTFKTSIKVLKNMKKPKKRFNFYSSSFLC